MSPPLLGVTLIESMADSGGSNPQFMYFGSQSPMGNAVVYRSSDGTNWTQINGTGTGFVGTGNVLISPNPVVQSGFLYIGTENSAGGQIWRRPIDDSANWTKVFDFATQPQPHLPLITYLYVFNNKIYFSVANNAGGNLYESSDGLTWAKNSGVGNGFGNANNVTITAMADFNGYLYATVRNTVTGGEVWRSSNGISWQQLVSNGFGQGVLNNENHNVRVALGRIWVTTLSKAPAVFQVWSSVDGVNFAKSNIDGFGDPNNNFTETGAAAMVIGFGNSVYWGGENTVTGAHIYRTTPAPSATPFGVPNLGATSIASTGTAQSIGQGYARIQPISGGTTPSGVAIFGLRQNNVLVSETGVPATAAVTAGRIYAEIAGPVNTGLAIANPNGSAATIDFSFTDVNGNQVGQTRSTTIAANSQIAKFLDSPPYNGPAGFQGTFSFMSSAPVGVVALRGFTNERGDFLMSTLPVVDTRVSPTTGTVVLPHFADGGGWTTQIFLVDPADSPMTGNVEFVDGTGAPTNMTIGGVTASSFGYSLQKRSSQKLVTAGTSATTASGSVRVVPAGGGAGPTPLVLFSYRPAGITVSEAGVPVNSGTAFRMYVESSGVSGQAGSIQTGITVANTAPSSASVAFSLTNLDGTTTGLPATVSINLPAFGQAAKFLADIFPTGLPNPFKGVLRITTTSAGLSVVGLRTRLNERQPNPDFLITTTPPTVESSPATTSESLFPHLADGGGYTTQFILFSGTAGQSSSGNLRLFDTSGQSLNLTLR